MKLSKSILLFLVCLMATSLTLSAQKPLKIPGRKPAKKVEAEPEVKLSVNETLQYINQNIRRYTASNGEVRSVRLNKLGQIEEKYDDGRVVTYYIHEIGSIQMTHFSSSVYRVRLTCSIEESSCIRTNDPNRPSWPHTNFYINTETEAKRLFKAFEHLKKKLEEEAAGADPFD